MGAANRQKASCVNRENLATAQTLPSNSSCSSVLTPGLGRASQTAAVRTRDTATAAGDISKSSS